MVFLVEEITIHALSTHLLYPYDSIGSGYKMINKMRSGALRPLSADGHRTLYVVQGRGTHSEL